ncbi:MAG: hypothetical protein JWP94_2207 [Mucilaginibacter sp.]|nr:hypothetical protein [Mucilaginibacter sp.]
MPVSRFRKKKHKLQKKPKTSRPKPYEVIKHDMVEIGNIFPEDMPFETRLKVILEMGKNATENFEADYLRLVDYLKEYDALYLLSYSVFYFLASQEGIDREAIEGYDDFPPFYIEVLQALALFQPRSYSPQPLVEKSREFYELLQTLNRNQSYRYFQLANAVKTEQELHAATLRMEMMTHTLAVRNWAYEPQMREVSYDLANLVRNDFSQKIGIDPIQLLDILFNSVSLTNERLNEHLNKLRSLKVKNYLDVFERYEKAFPEVDRQSDEVKKQIWQQSGRNIKMLSFFLFSHADLYLPKLFTFSFDDFKKLGKYEGDDEVLRKIFDDLSLNFEDLKDYDRDHIFLNNPVHQKPFIKVEDGGYFSAMNFLFFHLGVDLLEGFIARDQQLRDSYLKAKGKYLEDNLEKLFASAFPTGTLLSGSMWRDPISKKDYENDLVLLISDFAIIIEAKSGTITPPARRGATDRLAKTLKELVVDPSEQAIRFQNYLKSNQQLHHFKTKRGVINEIDSSKIKYYVPLGVTLSNLGGIGCNLKKLIGAGLAEHSLEELAPSISVKDLEIIFELLPLEAQKIHYLSRRREFEAHMEFHGDEMDLFAFYLDNGFNIGETEYDGSYHLNLTLKSKEIDPYIIGKSRGVSVKKPQLKMTKFWSDLLNKIDTGKGQMWVQSSYALLNAPEDDQRKFEQEFEKLKNMVRKGKAPKDHNWMLMSCGPARRKYAIIGYPYQNITKVDRNDILNRIVAGEDIGEYRGTVIIGQDIGRGHYPYSVLAGRLETDFFDSLTID